MTRDDRRTPGRTARALVALAAAGLCAGGCVSEGPKPRPEPRPLPEQPAAVQPDRLMLNVGQYPEDNDHNGYFDTILVTIYLFNNRYNVPLHVPGSLKFQLKSLNGEVLAEWELTPEETQAVRAVFLPGPAYQLTLNLNDVATDVLPVSQGILDARFVTETGVAVAPTTGSSVRLGRKR